MTSPDGLRWWQRGIIYQIYPRSFKDSNGDGIGDLQGIIDGLDHLVDLGVDALWISPFYPSPMVDFGYDVADYCDVHPLFGDLATFDRLVAAAHQRGLKLIIDWVPNHTSDQHAWFLESRSSRDNPKRDWYIWRDAKADGSLPNNWGSWFGGPAWEWDAVTGQYYLHSFTVEQPDLNWANPEVDAAMKDGLHFWMRRGVDGFRMDVVHLIVKDPGLRDNPLNPDASPDLPANDLGGRQIHLYDRANPGIHDKMKEFRRITDQYGDTVIVGEIWEFKLGEWVKYYGDGDGVQLPFNFRLMEIPRWDAALFRQSVDELEAALPPFAQPNYVLSSHDKPRIPTRYGAAQARVAAMLLFTLRGTPTMYNGDEIGMRDGVITPDQVQDPQGKILGVERSRDGCRTPLQWDATANAGFSTAAPWLPVNDDYAVVNIARQRHEPQSMLSLYRALIALRRAEPALHGGRYASLESPDGTYVYVRESGADRFVVALNFTDAPVNVPLAQGGDLLLSTALDRQEAVSGSVALRPNEGVIIRVK